MAGKSAGKARKQRHVFGQLAAVIVFRISVWKIHSDTKLAKGSRFIWRQYYSPELDITLRSEKITESGRVVHAIGYNKICKQR